jgi:uncharacterized membrane protein
MSNLVVIAYPEEHQAAEAMATLQQLQEEQLVDLEDAVAVTKDSEGQLKLHQNVSLTGVGAVTGAMSGAVTGAVGGVLMGMLGVMSIFGAALGAGVGAILRNLTDYGIEDRFVKELGAQLEPASSALFVLVRSSTSGSVLPELSKHGGTVLQTTLPAEAEVRIRATLQAGQTPPLPGSSERTA